MKDKGYLVRLVYADLSPPSLVINVILPSWYGRGVQLHEQKLLPCF